jgi:hypothetical protein
MRHRWVREECVAPFVCGEVFEVFDSSGSVARAHRVCKCECEFGVRNEL